jgi:DNA-directed RNA polymerase subunit RPC12/RpoP
MCYVVKMSADGSKDVFLSCFKCGRIVKSSDTECPRCGLQFGPGTLFECPFCCGLVWRTASVCTTCGIDLTKFSEGVAKASSGFDMDDFVDTMLHTELEEIKSEVRRVACPGCGLMIRGDEIRCPRCDLALAQTLVDCPVCGDRLAMSSSSCPNCGAAFKEIPGGAAVQAPAKEGVQKPPKQAPKKSKGPAKPKAAKKATPAKKKPAGRKPASK